MSLTLTENEIDILRWLIRAELKVQCMLLSESDGTLYLELEDLYDKISGLIPSMSLGMALEATEKPVQEFCEVKGYHPSQEVKYR